MSKSSQVISLIETEYPQVDRIVTQNYPNSDTCHLWIILCHFWIILCHFWIILGHSWITFCHFWVIEGHFSVILDLFVSLLVHFRSLLQSHVRRGLFQIMFELFYLILDHISVTFMSFQAMGHSGSLFGYLQGTLLIFSHL